MTQSVVTCHAVDMRHKYDIINLVIPFVDVVLRTTNLEGPFWGLFCFYYIVYTIFLCYFTKN